MTGVGETAGGGRADAPATAGDDGDGCHGASRTLGVGWADATVTARIGRREESHRQRALVLAPTSAARAGRARADEVAALWR
ncbi:hypothetical protein Misp05_46490 [Micromonospora sp. NBRC 107095]|nr:hypothetical protein Misp05_46490 [Micromonospora sp. NBRC 107095]